MKMKCEVIAVEGNGETMTIRLQGSRPLSAKWRRLGVHTIQVDETPMSQRTFYLGRKIEITVKPQ